MSSPVSAFLAVVAASIGVAIVGIALGAGLESNGFAVAAQVSMRAGVAVLGMAVVALGAYVVLLAVAG